MHGCNYSLKKKTLTNPWINLGPRYALAPGYTEIAARVTDALLSPPAFCISHQSHA